MMSSRICEVALFRAETLSRLDAAVRSVGRKLAMTAVTTRINIADARVSGSLGVVP
jgi:hypothetical protein